MDRSRSGRFSFNQYNNAGREAQMIIFDMYKKNEVSIREKLYTLLKKITATITTTSVGTEFTINHINYPTDYHYLSFLDLLVDGERAYVKPINNNELNPLLLCSFRKPSNSKVYHLEDSTGWTLYRGLGGTLAGELNYLIAPANYTIGTESDLINEGTGVLVNATSYICTAPSTHNSVNYNPGDQFTSANTNLTSGQVILASKTLTSNLPDVMHEDLARTMAQILQGGISAYDKSAFADKISKQAEQ
jgi:hypothetical protein